MKEATKAIFELLPDNTEKLCDTSPAWTHVSVSSSETQGQDSTSSQEASDEAISEEPEGLKVELQKTAFGDYIAEVPIAEGQFATIGVQQVSKKKRFNKTIDKKKSKRARLSMVGNFFLRVAVCVVLAAVVSVLLTALFNSLTIPQAIDLIVSGIKGLFGIA